MKITFPFSGDTLSLTGNRFTIRNTLNKDTTVILNTGKIVPLVYLYTLEKGRWIESGKTGYELPYSRQTMRGDRRRLPLFLSAGAESTFYICFKRYHDESGITAPFIQTKDRALYEFQSEESRQMPTRIVQLFLAGFFLAIFVYSLLKFFSQSHDKVYLYYALVNFFCCIAMTAYYNIPNLESPLFPWLKNNKEICAIFSDSTIIFNVLFLAEIMQLKTHLKRLYRFSITYIVFHILATVVVPVIASPPSSLLTARISLYLYPVCELLCLGLYVRFVIYLWKRREGFFKFLFYGCCIMTLGMFLFTMSSIFLTHEAFISKEGDIGGYVILAAFIISQVCFFITALTKRERQTEIANSKYQQELIRQLLEQERREKLLAVLSRRISETELKVLRSQMNPHFIFNSLNSIENFMMKNDKKMASDYFSKFASLIRMILDSSNAELVHFAQDVEALQLYVELEQLRFDNRFLYKTIIDPELLTGDYNVPPLLIQPYVENAILHGLAQSDRNELHLVVTASLEYDYLIYTIQDNGIGRKKAESYSKHKFSHKSMGMQITQERINILNQQQEAKGEVEIIDLYDDDKQPCGTRVQVKLKAV